MTRLTAAQVPVVKQAILNRRQGNRCPICEFGLTVVEGVMDHDHVTGMVRGILCRGCNGAEGKIKNAVTRYGGTKRSADLPKFLRNLATYLEYYRDNPNPFVYHLHRTADEKRLLVNKRARKKRAAKKKE